MSYLISVVISNVLGHNRERELSGSLPSQFHSGGGHLAPPTTRRRGGSVEEPTDEYTYGSVPRPSYTRPKKMRKTLSGTYISHSHTHALSLPPSPPSLTHSHTTHTLTGALDITEEVGAAVGIPHLPQIWEEVHRSHSRSRTVSKVHSSTHILTHDCKHFSKN